MQETAAVRKKEQTARGKSGGAAAGKLFYAITAVIGAALILISVPLLIVNGIIIVNSFVNPKQVPDAFGYKPFIVLSGSMEPTIMTGDLAIVLETDPAALQVGDVIAFRDGSSVVIHRIIGEQTIDGARQFTTQGDNNNTRDSKLVPYSAVEGKYLFRLPSLGDIGMFLQTPVGLILFMLIPFVLFIVYDRYRRGVLEQRDTEENARLREQLEERERQLAQRAAGSVQPAEHPIKAPLPVPPAPAERPPAPIPVPGDLDEQYGLLLKESGVRPEAAPAQVPEPPSAPAAEPAAPLGAMSAAEKKALLERLLAENQRLKEPPKPEPDPLELEIQRILEENRKLQQEREA